MDKTTEFFRDLWTRRVVQFAALYLGVAWILLQVAVTIEDTMNLPDWVDQTVLTILLIGFPLAIILAWAQDSTAAPSAPEEKASNTVAMRPPAKSAAISVAVIPFETHADDSKEMTLARGLSVEISNALSQVGSLRAVSSLAFGGEGPFDLKAIGEEWRVRYALTGSLTSVDEKIHVLTQLVAIEDGAQVWTGAFDEDQTDLIGIQKQIAENIVRQVGGEVMHAEFSRISSADVSNVDAWALTAHSAHIVIEKRGGAKTWDEAIEIIEKAIALAPDYGSAHARLAALCAERAIFFAGSDPQSDVKRSAQAAQRALQLAGNDPYTLMNVGQALTQSGDSKRGRRLLEQAIKMLPHDLLAWGFYWGNISGNGTTEEIKSIIDPIQKTLEEHQTHPVTQFFYGLLGNCYFRLGDMDNAVIWLRLMHENAPGYSLFGALFAVALLSTGEDDEAAAVWRGLKKMGFDTSNEHLDKVVGIDVYKGIGDALRSLNEMDGAAR